MTKPCQHDMRAGVCSKCGWKAPSKDFWRRREANLAKVTPQKSNSTDIVRDLRGESIEAMVSTLLGETVVTNDRVLNHALQTAANIIVRKDVSALDKFEMLAAYVLKARREVLGKPED